MCIFCFLSKVLWSIRLAHGTSILIRRIRRGMWTSGPILYSWYRRARGHVATQVLASEVTYVNPPTILCAIHVNPRRRAWSPLTLSGYGLFVLFGLLLPLFFSFSVTYCVFFFFLFLRGTTIGPLSTAAASMASSRLWRCFFGTGPTKTRKILGAELRRLFAIWVYTTSTRCEILQSGCKPSGRRV